MGYKELYPEGRCWIGTARDGGPRAARWEVSDGPAGSRGHSCDFRSARAALDFAREEGLSVTFEDDFEWGEDPPVPRFPDGAVLYAWKLRGADDAKLIAAGDDEAAARIAVRARIDLCEMSEESAVEAVLTEDWIAPVDPDHLLQGEVVPWDGPGDWLPGGLGSCVAKV